MAKRKTTLSYSQISSNYLSCDTMRRLVRQIRHRYNNEDKITQIKLLIIATLYYANREEGCGYYALFDDRYLDVMAEDTNIEESEITEYIEFLVDLNYYNVSFFRDNKILTNVDIQSAYFSAICRMKREMSEALPYLLVDPYDYYQKKRVEKFEMDYSEDSGHNSYQRQDVSVLGGHSSEERKNFFEEKKDSSPKRLETPAESGIIPLMEGEFVAGSGQSSPKKTENSSSVLNREKYIEDIRSGSSTEVRPYHHDEDYLFYLIFFMADAKDPSNEVGKFVTYNESRGWTNSKGVPYNSPRKRIAIAYEYSQKPFMPKGRITIPGLSEIKRKPFLSRLFAYLWEVYLFYRDCGRTNISIEAHYIFNANTSCTFVALGDGRYDLDIKVGMKTREQCLRDSDYLLSLAQKYFPGIREIHWTLANNQLHTIVPSK